MVRRLLVAGAVLISLAAGASPAFAGQIAQPPCTIPPGVMSAEPESTNLVGVNGRSVRGSLISIGSP